MISTAYYVFRESISWQFILFLIYSTGWMFMAFGLLTYHTKLITSNLTTNEDINKYRYSYLKDEYGFFKNPFSKGSKRENLVDGLFPSQKSYYSKEELLQSLRSSI